MAKEKRNWKCPQCSEVTNPEKLYQHTLVCDKWKAKFGESFPKFNYSPTHEGKKPLFEEGKIEGVDYLQCKACVEFGLDFRFSLMTQHIKAHNLTEKQYTEKYPDSKVRLEKTTERRKTTTLDKYGVDSVSKLEIVKEQIKQTNLERYGSENPMGNSEVRAKLHSTTMERYGVKNPFESADFQKLARERMVEKYGAHNPALVPEIVARRRETCLERYNAPSVLQSKEYLDRLHQEFLVRKQERIERLKATGKYETCPFCSEVFITVTSTHKSICEGWPNTPIPRTCLCGHESTSGTQMKRHRQECDIWLSRDKKLITRQRVIETLTKKDGNGNILPNGLERKVISFGFPIMFTGNWSFWRWLPKLKQSKNPDFILPGPNSEKPKKGVTKIIETFGDYWHSEKFTGKSNYTHELEVVEAYAEIGISCLVLWETEVMRTPEEARKRIEDFLVG